MYLYFFFNDTATTEIYTLSLHDALPILVDIGPTFETKLACLRACRTMVTHMIKDLNASLVDQKSVQVDRKSTRLNSSHLVISYAVFCLKKKKKLNSRPLGETY